jgi:3-oxoacyl-[acyl-carrier-protein] synthase II
MLSGQAFHRQVIEQGLDNADLSCLTDYLAHKQAVHLCQEYKLTGDYFIFSDACVSAASAIGYAFNSIREGSFDAALCGGYDVMSEFTFAGFNSLSAVTPTLCRPFDKQRDGMVLGEGAALLVLEEYECALKRSAPIIGEIAGYGESSDAFHMTSPEPSGHSAARAITNALEDCGSSDIDYINAHGTGTQYNDAMEAHAIIKALGEQGKTTPISSLKPLFGHTLGAAAAVEAVISVLVIKHNKIPPNINYHTPDSDCDMNVITSSTECTVNTVLSNSFGFGGSNAALIIKDFQ